MNIKRNLSGWYIEDEDDRRIFKRVNEIRDNSLDMSFMSVKGIDQSKITKQPSSRLFDQQNQQCSINQRLDSLSDSKTESFVSTQSRIRPKAGLIRQKQSKITQSRGTEDSNFTRHGIKSQNIQTKQERLPSIPLTTKKQTKKLFNVLNQQISYDQGFRKAKQCLKKMNTQDKYHQIQKYLRIHEINLTVQQIEKKFKVQQTQFNPFSEDIQLTYSQICEAWLSAQKYWKQNVKNKFNQHQLIKQGFSSLLTNQFSTSHFVSLLNCTLNSQFRNRDVIILFQRINQSNSTNTKLQVFLKQTCKIQSF